MITPITLPLSLTVTDGDQPIGDYQPLAIATTDKPMATPHLNINTGDPVRDARILAKLMSSASSGGWGIHDCTRPTPTRIDCLERNLKARKSAVRASGHTSWYRWASYHPNRPIPRNAYPILVAFKHTEGELDPLMASIVSHGRIYGVHAIHVSPLDALPDMARCMIDISVTADARGSVRMVRPAQITTL